ncbi:hypothetical protein ABIA52_003190 [Paenarthrobacter histidinolovorans]|uniref:Uncharacterized protein n=1 Tax=Paenarthrobacter histidinolovorans TaxID=43664 RepID=A0ABW8N9M4_9MICC
MGRDGCRVRAWVSYSRRRPGAFPRKVPGRRRTLSPCWGRAYSLAPRIFVGDARMWVSWVGMGVAYVLGCLILDGGPVPSPRRVPGRRRTLSPCWGRAYSLATRIFVGAADIRRGRADVGVVGRDGCRVRAWVSYSRRRPGALPLLGGRSAECDAHFRWGRADVGVVGRDGCRVRAWVSYSRRRPGAFPTEGAGPSSYFEAFAVLHTSMFVSMSGQTTSGGLQCRLFVLM